MGLLDSPIVQKVRRNHGLEHATIHILSRTNDRLSMVGRSDWGGFTLYGSVDTAEVRDAANEALRRLQAGESNLAVHPRCGTVLAVTGLMTGLAAFLAMGLDTSDSNKRFRWAVFPIAVMAATLAAIVAQPLGLLVQEKYTVTGEPGNLEIKSIRLESNNGMIVHRVETTQ